MLSAVFVSYRSASLALRAVASLRDGARAAGIPAEAICVVNSGDPGEARALEEAADLVVVPDANRGYAGGLNAGIAASRGEVLLLANPDVLFLPGAVGALAAAALSAPATIAGPAFYLDEAATLLHPPAEDPGPREVARRVLARDPERGALAFRRSVRDALALEELVRGARTGEAGALSGAVMAATRETAERVGPLDERFRLYHEENDWQRRLRASGGRLLVAGAARVVHCWAQSSRREPRAEAWFRESERLYFETYFGEAGLASLARDREAGPWPLPDPPEAPRLEWEPGRRALVALSPVPWFRPFALSRPAPETASFGLPGDVAAAHRGSVWYARAFDAGSLETLAQARLAPG